MSDKTSLGSPPWETFKQRPSRIASWLEATAMQFSFDYCIDPEVHKTKEEIKAIAVKGAIWPKALTGCQGLVGSALQDGALKHFSCYP